MPQSLVLEGVTGDVVVVGAKIRYISQGMLNKIMYINSGLQRTY